MKDLSTVQQFGRTVQQYRPIKTGRGKPSCLEGVSTSVAGDSIVVVVIYLSSSDSADGHDTVKLLLLCTTTSADNHRLCGAAGNCGSLEP